MKKAEIHTKKEIERDLGYPELIGARSTDLKTVYIPIGELHGMKILIKYKIKKRGEYLILE